MTTPGQDITRGHHAARPSRIDGLSTKLLVLLVLAAAWIQIRAATGWGAESWQMTEWLIHYADGFVRRGLAGSVLLWLSRETGIPANQWVIAVSLACHVALVAWLLRKATRLFPAALLVSAMMAGFPPLQDCIVRKDSCGLLCLIACLTIHRRIPHPWMRWTAVNLVACTAILIHESFAFYGLAALVLTRVAPGGTEPSIQWIRRALMLLPAAACLLLTVRFHGTPETSRAIHQALLPLWAAIDPAEAPPADPTAAIAAISWTLRDGVDLTRPILQSGGYQAVAWATVFLTTFVLVLWFVRHHPDPRQPGRRDLAVPAALLLLQLLCISPLFVLGIDYGRWLFFWTTSTVILAACGRHAPEWLEQAVARAIRGIRLDTLLDLHPPRPWILLVFGVPVCWSLRNFLTAGPLIRHLDWLHARW